MREDFYDREAELLELNNKIACFKSGKEQKQFQAALTGFLN